MKKKIILWLCKLWKFRLAEDKIESKTETIVKLLHQNVNYKEISSSVSIQYRSIREEDYNELMIEIKKSLLDIILKQDSPFVEVLTFNDDYAREHKIKVRMFIGEIQK